MADLYLKIFNALRPPNRYRNTDEDPRDYRILRTFRCRCNREKAWRRKLMRSLRVRGL